MSYYAEPPLNEFEERWFLAEILKHSPIAPGILLNLIAQGQFEPAWGTIVPPYGRSIAACQNAFSFLTTRRPPNSEPTGKNVRHPFQLGETSLSGERSIQPRPSAFRSVNGQQQQIQLGEDSRPKKKRGRPSKEVHEQRVAEAASRGEIYPPPKKIKTPRPSLEATGATAVPGAFEASIEAGPSGSASPTSIKKKPQFQPASERNVIEQTLGASTEDPAVSSAEIPTSTAPTLIPGGLLLEPLPTAPAVQGTSPTVERSVQANTEKGGNSGIYRSPFASEPSHLASPSVPLAEPNRPATTQH